MEEEKRLSRFSSEDAVEAIKELTDAVAALKGKGTIDSEGGKSWFFPDGIDLIDAHVKLGPADVELKIAGPKSSQAVLFSSKARRPSGVPSAVYIEVGDDGPIAHPDDTIIWHNGGNADVVVYFDTFYGCPFVLPDCPQFKVLKGKTHTTTVRHDACGPYFYHFGPADAPEESPRLDITGMPRIIIQ